jgi:hypothetical protein
MFYKALGFAVWKLGVRYARRRFGHALRTAAIVGAVGLAALAAAGYVATRSTGE